MLVRISRKLAVIDSDARDQQEHRERAVTIVDPRTVRAATLRVRAWRLM
jgi:hypothetical protein